MTNVGEFVSKLDGGSEEARKKATRERDIANTLLANPTFVDWAGDAMVAASYFGEGRELTPYQQGLRGGVVRLFEALAEKSDNGAEFIAKVFSDKVVGGVKKKR